MQFLCSKTQNYNLFLHYIRSYGACQGYPVKLEQILKSVSGHFERICVKGQIHRTVRDFLRCECYDDTDESRSGGNDYEVYCDAGEGDE